MSALQLDDRGVLVECPKCGQRNRLNYERLRQTFRCGKCRVEMAGPSEPVDVATDAQFVALTSLAALPVFVDFWAPWCGPCKMVAPEVSKVAAEGAGRWVVAKVNTEVLTVLAQRFSISGIPTFILFNHGNEVARRAGAISASQMRQLIEGR